MNKTAIKNFAIWARNKLIADINYKAGLLGITEKGIKSPLPQSTQTVQFFDIGTKEPSSITGIEIQQRKRLVEEIERKAKQSDYATAYKNVIEEVAYTWFNRLIAIRFMEVNDYLPTRIRVLSSESNGKAEPDLVTHALEANLDYSAYEKDRIIQLKHENKLDELFGMLFIKQCNALNDNLPELFEKTSNYSELLLNVSITDKEGIVYHLVNDIDEDNFNVSKEGQVEIIGWLYQYYNTEPKDETFALLRKNVRITKERIPAATQLFTPDWIVRYMVENSLGRLWVEGHPNDKLKSEWKFYLDESNQEENVQKHLEKISEELKTVKPEDIKIIDPAMGSGHILVYAFDVLMQIYESYGYSQRDAAKSIVENNLYGLDIDNRAYQLAYFAVMMKARQHNRKILSGDTTCHVYAIQESNDINMNQLKYFGVGLNEMEKNAALLQMQGLLDAFNNAKEFGSILNIEIYNWELLRKFINTIDADGQMSLDTIGVEHTKAKMNLLVDIGEVMAQKYDVVITNPPYMGSNGMSVKLSGYVKKYYPDSKSDLFAVFIEKCTQMTKINRYQAMLTQHAFMFLSSFEKIRSSLLHYDLVNMVHLGARAFEEIAGEVVQTASFVIRKSNTEEYNAKYFRLVDLNSQEKKERAFIQRKNLYITNNKNFKKIPGSPIAYWVKNNVFEVFAKGINITEYIDTFQGIITGDNNKFLRLWFELQMDKIAFGKASIDKIDLKKQYWIPYNKGGSFRNWYGNQEYVINWKNGPDDKTRGKKSFQEYYLREYVSWSYIATNTLATRYFPQGFLWDVAGSGIFDKGNMLFYLQSLIGSKVGIELLKIINPTINYQVENIAQIPVLINKKEIVDDIAKANIEVSKLDWDSFETSWDFTCHPLIKFKKEKSISESFADWRKHSEQRFLTFKNNQEEINRIFIDTYKFDDDLSPEIEDENVTISRADTKRDIASFISYSVGCMFGRYSLDVNGIAYAGGEWDDNKYNTFIPDKDNILPITDEEYLKDDIVGLFIDFVKKVFGKETLEENLDFIANAIGKKGNSSREIIRSYFIDDFFKDHCSTYSVTGSGKRPIYWLFDSGNQNGFKALVYVHRFDGNTIGNLRIDYLHRMQRIYENEIARMQDTIENSRDAREVTAANKRKEKLIKQLQETKEYDEKIAHLALARTSIDLDDGVKVNYEKVQTDRDGKKLDVLAKI